MQWYKWLPALSKRLYKKPAFLAILAIIPLCVAALSFAASREAGFLKVALAQTDPADAISSAVMAELTEETSLIQFTVFGTPQEARRAVESGKADVAWIFPENMKERIAAFVTSKSERHSVVSVVAREQTVFSRISQEKLTAALYKYCAEAQYLDYIRDEVPELALTDDKQLLNYYRESSLTEDLFTFESLEGEQEVQANYMTTPIRGLLSIVVCLCSAAATLFYMHDEKAGTFALVKERARPFVAFLCVMLATVHVAAIVPLALWSAGLLTSVGQELVSIVLHAIACSCFCLFLKQLLPESKLYSAVIPLLTIVMIAVCPVFFNFNFLAPLAHIFPPTYYTHGIYHPRYLGYTALYSLGLTLVSLLLQKVKEKRCFHG